jgi:hypothetical protein
MTTGAQLARTRPPRSIQPGHVTAYSEDTWMPDAARYRGRTYSVLNWLWEGREPAWVLRADDGDTIVVADSQEPGTEPNGRCPVCSSWTLRVADQGPSKRGPEWVCLTPHCDGLEPPRFPVPPRRTSRDW